MQFPSFLGRSLIGRFLALLLAVTLSVQPAMAQSMLRDAETEALLADMSAGIIQASGLQPKNVQIVLLQDKEINAFVAGGQIVYIHSGLITAAKNANEVQGVIAHEMAHVTNRDTLVSAVAATTAGAIAILSDMLTRMMWFGGGRDRDRESNGNPIALVFSLLILILAPLAAMLLKSAISRKRESLADATAVAFTRNPAGLRSALEVLASDSTVVRQKSNSIAHIWIESPLDGKSVSKLFSTHPPIAERIAVLKAMESLN